MTTKRQKQLAKERRRREWAEKSLAAKIFWIVVWMIGFGFLYSGCSDLIKPFAG